MWGFLTVLNDILIPHLRKTFELSDFESMFVNFSFFIAYFIGSLFYFLWGQYKGDPINRIGYKNGILIGLFLCIVGTLMFFPASASEEMWIYMLSLFIIGLGFTLLQITCNPYVSILGAPEGATSRLNLAQGINSLGTTLSPIVSGYLIFQYFDPGNEIKFTYLIFAVIFFLLVILIYFSPMPNFKSEETIPRGWGALKIPQVRWGMIAIFFYVGAEVTIGSKIVELLAFDSYGSISEATAKNYVGLYWGGAMIGRFIGFIAFERMAVVKKVTSMFAIGLATTLLLIGIQFLFGYLIADRTTLTFAEIWPVFLFVPLHILGAYIGQFLPGKVISIFSFISIALLIIGVFTAHTIGLWAIIGIGFFNSIMWSNIFTISIQNLGKFTTQASSFLVMMILGGALIPLAFGGLTDTLKSSTSEALRYVYLFPIISYVFLMIYGIQPYKTKYLNTDT